MRFCCGHNRNLFCSHSFIKALSPVGGYHSQSRNTEPETELLLGTECSVVGHGPPSSSPSAPASASGYSFPWASSSPCCSAVRGEQHEHGRGKLESIWGRSDLTAGPALLLAQGNSWEFGWKGTGQLLSALPWTCLTRSFQHSPRSSSSCSGLHSAWFTYAHMQP